MDPIEEQFYAIAGQEVASRKMSPGLMAKALVDADGDERKAAAAYIRMRVEQLKAEYVARVKEEAVREKERNERAKVDAQEKLRVLSSKCPGCGFVGQMNSSFIPPEGHKPFAVACQCPKCRHRFDWYHYSG